MSQMNAGVKTTQEHMAECTLHRHAERGREGGTGGHGTTGVSVNYSSSYILSGNEIPKCLIIIPSVCPQILSSHPTTRNTQSHEHTHTHARNKHKRVSRERTGSC